jgi:hypothetical protein
LPHERRLISEAMDLLPGALLRIVGGTDVIKKFAEAAEALMQGRRAAWHADLGAFKPLVRCGRLREQRRGRRRPPVDGQC